MSDRSTLVEYVQCASILYTSIRSCHGNPTPELIVTLDREQIAHLIVTRWEPR